jgi:hypothetical protein
MAVAGGPNRSHYGIVAAKTSLVQRIGGSGQHARALRSQDGEVPDLGDPLRGGVVRHMVATPEGDLALACSGVNRVALSRNQVEKGPFSAGRQREYPSFMSTAPFGFLRVGAARPRLGG